MQAVVIDFGIEKALIELGVKEINEGTSTGSNWFSKGELVKSYSPVDGKLIGSVKSTTKDDYEKMMKTATSAFKVWRLKPAPQTRRNSSSIWR